MKWTAVLLILAIGSVFYLMGNKPAEDIPTQRESVRYQDDTYDEFEEDKGDDPSWQNNRANKIMPLGSNLD